MKTKPDAEVKLVKSGGGVFEISVDGKLAYSKKQTGDFPSSAQVIAAISRA